MKRGDFMALSVTIVNNMLNTLEEEDYKMAISYIQFLADSRKKTKAKKTAEIMDEIQTLIGNDKGWNSEQEMLADMAKFRKERMGI